MLRIFREETFDLKKLHRFFSFLFKIQNKTD